MRVQLGVGEVEAGALGEGEVCEVLEEVEVGAGNLGLHAKLHYKVLVVVHPLENQRRSALMEWVGLGQEGEGPCWLTGNKRGLCCSCCKSDTTCNTASDYATGRLRFLKPTYL